jgi:LysR family transcriptional regulator, low CO2-responsive transcriptional regulator
VTTEARLRAFVAVAETGSVRGAAQRLVVTESAVSAAVSALTRDVGAALLERQGRGLRLTASGQTYAEYARTILGLHAEALAAARGEADPASGQVRLAAVTTAGEHVLPVVLASFRAEHPGIELGLEVGTREHVWGLLAAHEADLVIAGRAPASLGAVVRAVRRNALIVVGSPEVTAGFDLERTTWLMREAGSGTRQTCEALLASLDVEPPTLTLGSNGAVVAGAAAGLGVTLVSRDAVRGLLAAGDVAEVPVPQTPMQRPWHAVTYPRATAATEVLVAHLLAQESPPESRWHRPAKRRSSAAPSASRQAAVPTPAHG